MNRRLKRGAGAEALSIMVRIPPANPLHAPLSECARARGIPRAVRLLQLAALGLGIEQARMGDEGAPRAGAHWPPKSAPHEPQVALSAAQSSIPPAASAPPSARKPVTHLTSRTEAPVGLPTGLGLDAFDQAL